MMTVGASHDVPYVAWNALFVFVGFALNRLYTDTVGRSVVPR
jgi:hypothetical protein